MRTPNCSHNMQQKETKFRAYHYEKEKMYYSSTPEDVGKPYYSLPHFRFYAGGCWDLVDSKGKVLVNNITGVRMEYIGFKDKNGKEIYEGDIILDNGKRKVIVEWSKDTTGFEPFIDQLDDSGDWCGGDDCEVIGNKWKNPELFK